jgi:peptide/nickel transport system substrate-binding protein
MDEHAIRELVGEVKRGRLSRRRFVQTMLGVGLTAPMATHILA